ncbi:MAG: tetratricopeptide repeat-containing protein [Terricaulis sp.]
MRLLLCCIIALFSASTNAFAQDGAWLRAETPGFIVFSTSSETRVREVAEDLEAFDALLRRMTQTTAERSPTKLEIYLFNGPGQFQEAFPGDSLSIRGRYGARSDIIAAYAIFRDREGLGAQDVLFHEYAHHFMYQYFANNYPAWYVEGFAEFVSTAAFEDGRIVIGRAAQVRAEWLHSGSWLPMERLIDGMPTDGEDVARFYAQSWLFVHYIFHTEGMAAKFQSYVRAMRLGAPPEQAFQTGFGMTPLEMQSALRAYFRSSPNALALTRPVIAASQGVTITRLPTSANAMLPLTTRVRRGYLSDEDASELLTRMRRMVSNPRDSFAVLSLAEAEASYGDVAAARALLEPYSAAHPDDVQALYLLGRTYSREADEAKDRDDDAAREAARSQARRYYTRAFRADGNHVPTLYRYAQTFAGAPLDAAGENAMNALLLAHQLAPQVSEITFMAADWLLTANRPAEAIPMLRVIAFSPHGGESADRAKEMLTRAEAAVAAQAPAQ